MIHSGAPSQFAVDIQGRTQAYMCRRGGNASGGFNSKKNGMKNGISRSIFS
jgi:hypothetical protein